MFDKNYEIYRKEINHSPWYRITVEEFKWYLISREDIRESFFKSLRRVILKKDSIYDMCTDYSIPAIMVKYFITYCF